MTPQTCCRWTMVLGFGSVPDGSGANWDGEPGDQLSPSELLKISIPLSWCRVACTRLLLVLGDVHQDEMKFWCKSGPTFTFLDGVRSCAEEFVCDGMSWVLWLMQQSGKGGVDEADVCCECALKFLFRKNGKVTILWYRMLVVWSCIGGCSWPDHLLLLLLPCLVMLTVGTTGLPAVALLMLVVVAGAHPWRTGSTRG